MPPLSYSHIISLLLDTPLIIEFRSSGSRCLSTRFCCHAAATPFVPLRTDATMPPFSFSSIAGFHYASFSPAAAPSICPRRVMLPRCFSFAHFWIHAMLLFYCH